MRVQDGDSFRCMSIVYNTVPSLFYLKCNPNSEYQLYFSYSGDYNKKRFGKCFRNNSYLPKKKSVVIVSSLFFSSF